MFGILIYSFAGSLNKIDIFLVVGGFSRYSRTQDFFFLVYYKKRYESFVEKHVIIY